MCLYNTLPRAFLFALDGQEIKCKSYASICCYFGRELLKILVATPDCFNVGANCAISRFKEKNWLARLHCHRHQTSIMLKQRKAVRIFRHSRCSLKFLIQHSIAINTRDAIHPPFIGLNRAAIEDAMLHDDVTDGLHRAFGHWQIIRRLGEKVGPDGTPLAQGWP